MSETYGLVLEGGGMRGAYTAGALAWMNDHDLYLDYSVGISSGAVYLCCYLMQDKKLPRLLATEFLADKSVVGFQALRREHHLVAYTELFNKMEAAGFDAEPLRQANPNMEFGAYDLNVGQTLYFGPQDLDAGNQLLLAACSLPIVSARVKYNNTEYIDGGMIDMIPIFEALKKGVTKALLITTKPEGYVRKPAPWYARLAMQCCYHDYPKLLHDYKIRHLNYQKQIEEIARLEKEGKALNLRPSKSLKVGRFSGSKQDLEVLYQLGYQDMEDRKETISAFLNRPL